jgi:hypothetical protein
LDSGSRSDSELEKDDNDGEEQRSDKDMYGLGAGQWSIPSYSGGGSDSELEKDDDNDGEEQGSDEDMYGLGDFEMIPSLPPPSRTPSSRGSSPALSQPTTPIRVATIPPASETSPTTHATTPSHTVPALYLASKETHLESPSHPSPKISTRVRPRRVIKQKVRDDQAMSDEEGCANSNCDDPSRGGEMVHCAGLSCPRQVQ